MEKSKVSDVLNNIDNAYMDALWIGRSLSERWQGITEKSGDDVWAMLSAYFDMVEARFEKMRNEVKVSLTKEE